MTKKLVFAGCSFTAGVGWSSTDPSAEYPHAPNLWTNLCHREIPDLRALESVNVSRAGASNTEIFQQAAGAMAEFGSDISTLLCQWTAGPRYNFNAGFELWDTSESLHTEVRSHDVRLNRGDHWPREYVRDLLDRLRVMHHLHWEILAVVRLSNLLKGLARRLGIGRMFFVNGACAWDKNYFVKLENVLPESYTPFTKKHILNIESRDDQDIFKLYDIAHSHYSAAGGIDPQDWINLYDSFLDNRTDVNFDNQHPGTQSNQTYHDLVKQKLQST